MALLRSILFAALALWAVSCSDDGGTRPDAALPDAARPDLAVDVTLSDVGDLTVDSTLADTLPPDAPCPDPGVTLASGVIVSPTQLAPGGQATVTYPAGALLAGGASVTLHYGFNYWDLDLGGDVAKDAPMTKQADGSFTISVPLAAGARLLDMAFFSETSSGKQWDNNGGADFHRSVGVPLLGPYLTLRDNLGGQPDRDPSQGITINFRTDHSCVGQVRYGTSATAMTQFAAESVAATQHHLHLKGLAPDTLHHYQTGCVLAGACSPPETSPTFSFRTAKKGATALKLVLLSDPQDYRAQNDRWPEVAAALTQPPHDDARLLIISGDLAGDDEPLRWWDFFDGGRALLASRPVVPAVGNHDTPSYSSNADTSSFESLFAFESASGSETYYGLTYGPAAFLVLNSELSQTSPDEWKPGGSQYQWAASFLAKPSPWRFATWHIPPYNAGVRHSGQVDAVRPVTALFNDKIDWVLGGHEHLYQRFKPIRFVELDSAGKVVSTAVASHGGPGGGVGYIVAPAAGHDPPEDTLLPVGNPMRDLIAYPTLAGTTVDKWVGFVTIQITGKTITIQATDLDQATPRDTLTYTRP